MRSCQFSGIALFLLAISTACYATPVNHDVIRSISINKNSIFPAGAKIVALGENEFYILGKNETLHLNQKPKTLAENRKSAASPIHSALKQAISVGQPVKANYKEVIKYSTYNGKKVKMISYVVSSPKETHVNALK